MKGKARGPAKIGNAHLCMTQQEVASELGITQTRVHQLEKRALRKVRATFLRVFGEDGVRELLSRAGGEQTLPEGFREEFLQ